MDARADSRTLAYALTNVLNPFLLFTALFAAVSFSEAGFYSGLGYVLLELLAAALVAGYVLLMRRRKRVGDFWISTRGERLAPAVFLMTAFAGLLLSLYLFGAPEEVFSLTLSMGLASGAVALVTLLWKASAHCAVAGHAAAAGVVLFGFYGVVFFLLLPAVIWARIRLEAHTILQTLAGASIGAIFALMFLV